VSGKGDLIEYLKGFGYRESDRVVELVQRAIWDDLREEFLRLLSEGHRSTGEDFEILQVFDQAVNNMKGKRT